MVKYVWEFEDKINFQDGGSVAATAAALKPPPQHKHAANMPTSNLRLRPNLETRNVDKQERKNKEEKEGIHLM